MHDYDDVRDVESVLNLRPTIRWNRVARTRRDRERVAALSQESKAAAADRS